MVEPIIAPSFDHAVKDPDPTGIKIYPWHRIVVIEGLYCFLSVGAWQKAGEMLDERWLITVDVKEATKRIIDRHLASGVAESIEVGCPFLPQCSLRIAHEWYRKQNGRQRKTTCKVSTYPRAPTYDHQREIDGEFLLDHLLGPTRIIKSVQTSSFKIQG